MAIYILQQIVKNLTTKLLGNFTDPGSFFRKADKRFWQGFFFGQIVVFFALLILIQVFVK